MEGLQVLGLGLGADLKDVHTAHIQQVAPFDLHHTDERRVAERTADHRPHPVYVSGGRPHRRGL
jgi:hypothetical protein